MNSTIESLLKDSPVITDGAWGTMLQSSGLGIGESPDSWNLFYPDRVEHVARSYVQAGSKIILTNTFRGNRIALEQHNLGNKVVEINQRGVELSLKAAGDKSLVFSSMGPTGKLLMTGDVSESVLREVFSEQAEAVAAAGAHGIVLETFSDSVELKQGILAAQKTGLPVVACMAFDSGKDKTHTMMGVSPEQAAAELTELQVDVVGANCGQGIESYHILCSRLRESTTLPIWVKPNAGTPQLIDGKPVYMTKPAEFAEHLPALIECGADFIGGCCGTNFQFIEALSQKRDSLR